MCAEIDMAFPRPTCKALSASRFACHEASLRVSDSRARISSNVRTCLVISETQQWVAFTGRVWHVAREAAVRHSNRLGI